MWVQWGVICDYGGCKFLWIYHLKYFLVSNFIDFLKYWKLLMNNKINIESKSIYIKYES